MVQEQDWLGMKSQLEGAWLGLPLMNSIVSPHSILDAQNLRAGSEELTTCPPQTDTLRLCHPHELSQMCGGGDCHLVFTGDETEA